MPVSHRTKPIYRGGFPGRFRHGIAALILAVSVATLSNQAGNQAQSAETTRVPNIVLILADDKN